MLPIAAGIHAIAAKPKKKMIINILIRKNIVYLYKVVLYSLTLL